jgi:hypothetical protein
MKILENGAHDRPVNMHRAFHSFALDIITTYCFAQDYCTVETKDFKHQITLDFETIFPMILIWKHVPWLYKPLVALDQFRQYLYSILGVDVRGGIANILKNANSQVAGLLAHPEKLEQVEHETIYHHLLTPHPNKGRFGAVPSQKSLVEEAMILLAAGGDTVGNTCTIGAFYVLDNPSILRKIVEELDKAWADNGAMELQDLEKLPYLVCPSLDSRYPGF